MSRFPLVVALIALGLLLTPAGVSATPAAQNTAVQALDNFFQPQTITVPVGTTIVWTNAGQVPHTVTADDKSWDSGNLNPGQSFSHTFNTPGTFGYYCVYHGAPGSGMFGTVTVTAAAAPAAPPAAPAAAAPTAAPAAAAPTRAPAPAARAGATVSFSLAAQSNSGITGTATLTDLGNGQTRVVLQLANAGAGPEPAHIHMGTCANLDPKPQYPLMDVMNGTSETTVNASLASIMDGNHAINVHKSAAEIQTYVACGNIPRQAAVAAQLPNTGTAVDSEWALLLGTLGLLGLGVGYALRRRSARSA